MAQPKPHNTAAFLNYGTTDQVIMCENDAKTVEQAIGRRPAPPVLERDGFALCDNVFTVGGYERVQGKRLAQLFNPRICKTGHLFTQASNEAATLFKKNFFAAQLRHHDIKFKASATAAELRGLLESAVHQGQVRARKTLPLRLQARD